MCQAFPFFERPAWRGFAKNVNLVTMDDLLGKFFHHLKAATLGVKPKARLHYELEVRLPKLSDYVGDSCFDEDGAIVRNFTFKVELRGPEGYNKESVFHCRYGNK